MATLLNHGDMFGRYGIISEIGRGGFAHVYEAYHIDLHRIVALKVCKLYEAEMVAIFLHGARIGAFLEHPNIVSIYDAGNIEGAHYISMKLISGDSLDKYMEKERNLTIQKIYDLIDPVASALDYAHSQSVVHGDIKPGNILMDRSEVCYLSDFELSRRMKEDDVDIQNMYLMGTPGYISPERANKSEITPETDVFSLGVILYELITGVLPFGHQLPVEGEIDYGDFRSVCDFRDDIPATVDKVLLRALDKRPGNRYPTAKSLCVAFREAALVVDAEEKSLSITEQEYMKIHLRLRKEYEDLELEIEHLRELNYSENRRRRLSEVRRAIEGYGTPNNIIIELDELEASIARREKLIRNISEQIESKGREIEALEKLVCR